ALLSLAFSLAYPKLTQFVIDDVITRRRIELLTPMMLGLIGAFLLRDLFNSLRIRINNTFEQNVIYDMRREVYARLQRLPVNYFDPRASGDLMTRVIEDVNAVERVLIDGTEQGTVALLSIVGVLAFLFYTNATLTWAALGSGLVLWAGGRMVVQGTMTLGQLVGFLFFLALFYEPVARLHGLNQMMQAARAAGERVFDILDATAESANPKRQESLREPV